MASSSPWTPGSLQDRSVIRQSFNKINDALYELYKPSTGFIDIEIVFFHGFQSQSCEDAYLNTWILEDDFECWLNTWLPEEFPQARILSVSYDSSIQVLDSTQRMDMHLTGEYLAQSIIGVDGIGQSCPVVLVGHCIGGIVLKQVCLKAKKMGSREMDPSLYPYKTFMGSMKGAFFYSTPNLGSRVKPIVKQKGPLLQYLELLDKDAARLSCSFAELRHQQGWKTYGVGEANETEDSRSIIGVPHPISRFFSWKPQKSFVVEEASGRYDMDEFCVLSGEDNYTICKPRDRSSNNYQCLIQFVRNILQTEEAVKAHWRSTLRLPPEFTIMPRLMELVTLKLQLGKAGPSRVALLGMGGIGKTTLAKAVLMQIRTQFDVSCFVEDVKDRLKPHSVELQDLISQNLYIGGGRKVRLHDVDAQSLWLYLRGKKVLMILDDVETEQQISGLLSPNWLGRGSRLIVTCRIRSRQFLPTFSMLEVPFFSKRESHRLFLLYLEADVLREIPEDLVLEVMLKCDGLPLTLEVIGRYLRFDTNVDHWTSALEKLTRAESLNESIEDSIWAKLKVSFDDLAPLERKMFLDIAVFDECCTYSKQADLDVWRAVWETGGDGLVVDNGLRNLVDRSLSSKRLSRIHRQKLQLRPTLQYSGYMRNFGI